MRAQRLGLEVSWFKFSTSSQKLSIDHTRPLSALGAETTVTGCCTLHRKVRDDLAVLAKVGFKVRPMILGKGADS